MPIVSRMQQYALFGLFALSGFSGLIYESIWSHYLKLFLGHSAYAQNLVLGIFMGGMAAGAWLASRFMARLSSPLLAYVVIELLIGIFGIAFHPLFVRVTDFMLDDLLPGMQSVPLVELTRWSIAAALILPQTLLLGATFPLMSAGLLRHFPHAPGHAISWLYFSNSMGAVIGVLASGFILIGLVGLPGTVLTAGLVNFLLAACVYLLARVLTPGGPQAPATGAGTAWLMPLLSVAFTTGLSSFIYEIGWIRMLSLVLGASTHAFELMLAAFILGLALGGLWIRTRIDRFSNPMRVLGWVQLLMGLLALTTVVAYNQLFDLMAGIMSALARTDSGYLSFNVASHLIAIVIMLPVTFMAGMTLPLITLVLFNKGEGEAAIGKVYASNTLGAIVGVWLSVQYLMPALGLKNTIMIGAALDVALAIWLFWRVRVRTGFLLMISSSVSVVFLLIIMGVHFNSAKMISGVYRTGEHLVDARTVFHKDGKAATIDVYDHPDGLRVIATNGKPDAAASIFSDHASDDEPTMVLLGAMPQLFFPEARTAAVIGMGSGMSANVMLSSPALEQLDVIEIEAAMVEGARLFGHFSERVYGDPRSHIHIDDAKSYFAAHRKHYDVIVSEPSNPWVSGVASLFSEEFYARISSHLTDDGILVQWFQGYENNVGNVASIMKALSGHFDDYRIFASTDSDYVLVAKKHGVLPAMSGQPFTVPAFRSDLQRVAMFSLEDVELHEVGSRALLQPLFTARPVPANSDYFPYVDQHAVRARFKEEFVGLSSLREFGLPLPGSNFRGDIKTSEQTPALAFTPRLMALRAQVIMRYLQRPNAAFPDIGPSASRALMLAMSPLSCGSEAEAMIWRDSVTLLARMTASYYSAEEMNRLVRRFDKSLCPTNRAGQEGRLLALLSALGQRDPQAMIQAARAYLGNEVGIGQSDKVYALHVLMLAHTLSGQHQQVLKDAGRYAGEPTAVMELLLAHAYAGLAKN